MDSKQPEQKFIYTALIDDISTQLSISDESVCFEDPSTIELHAGSLSRKHLVSIVLDKDFIVTSILKLLDAYPTKKEIETAAASLAGNVITRNQFIEQLIQSERFKSRRLKYERFH